MLNTFRALEFDLSEKDLRIVFVEGDEIDPLRLISGALLANCEFQNNLSPKNQFIKTLIKLRIDSDVEI